MSLVKAQNIKSQRSIESSGFEHYLKENQNDISRIEGEKGDEFSSVEYMDENNEDESA